MIYLIGLGAQAKAELSKEALEALNQAANVVGSERQLDTVKHLLSSQKTHILPKLSELEALLTPSESTSFAILASGDPLFYGLGKWLSTRFEVTSFPGVSSLQLACHRLGLSLQDVSVVSVHGRPLISLRRSLRANRDYLLLTDETNNPCRIAGEVIRAGFERSSLTVLEDLGYPSERIRHFSLQDLPGSEETFSPLNICYLHTAGAGGILPEFPGIPDGDFWVEDARSMITKREVRLAILSLLQPRANEVGWDVGAGSGSVAVEWGLWSGACVYAVEMKPERVACIEANISKFGVQNLHVVKGRAPEVLTDLPTPHAVFIGGSDGDLEHILTYCYRRLAYGGRLVVSAVTEQARATLHAFANRIDGKAEVLEIAVSKSTPLGRQSVLKPALPVLLMKISK